MNKYIKLKDKIIKIDAENNKKYYFTDYTVDSYGNSRKTAYYLYKEQVKAADTIEKLCDEFVIIYNKNIKFKKPFTSCHNKLKNLLKEHYTSECKIYGAIWTDKGLIYVAKVNDEGKLELI